MSKPEGITSTEERKNLIWTIWVTLLILLLIGIIAILLFAWPGWFTQKPAIMGCTSNQWTTPDGKLEVFTDQEISPDDAWICMATSPEGLFNWERYQEVEEPETVVQMIPKEIPCEPVPCESATEEVSVTTGWIGDDFGPEKPLPDIVTGPAIANIWNQKTGFCATVKIDEGVELNYKHSGAYWIAGSQQALDARWPHHRQEYINEPSLANCQALTDISVIPQQ